MATIPASENEFPQVLLAEGAAPATPGTGLVVVYVKSDGKVYSKDDAGTETELAAATAALAAHLADTADAHDASAISVLDTAAVFTATDVETALKELYDAIGAGGIPATIIDAKGDLIAGSAADTAVRVAVGTTRQRLVADSGQTSGLAWDDGDHTHAAAGASATGGGATLNPANVNISTLFRLSGLTTSTINADQNDWNPTGIHTTPVFYFNSFTANRTITGINAGSTGEVLILQNNNTFSLLLTHESGSSSANNRFRCPNAATHTIRQGGSALLVYIQSRWCVMAA